MRLVAAILLLAVISAAGGVVAASHGPYAVGLDSVLEIWRDALHDADHVGLTVTRISPRREMEIGATIADRIARYRTLADDSPAQAYVAAVGARLARQVQRPGIAYHFHIIRSPAMNAHAIPGGGIYVTTGMLQALESEAELAALLGHEISHVDLRHAIERVQYRTRVRDLGGGAAGDIAAVVHTLVRAGYSSQQELEADTNGMLLALKAGYDPRGAVALYQKLLEKGTAHPSRPQPQLMVQEVGGALVDALLQYFASHPPSEARVRAIEAAVRRHAALWSAQRVYVGRANYRDRATRDADPRADEWQVYQYYQGR